MLFPADTDGLGSIVSAAGGDGVVQGVGKEVLDGLLRSGKLEEGREYLKKLEAVSESLSFPYQTGNPVVDILLGEKGTQQRR